MPAGAFPPLPSSVYGTIVVNGTRVADGTLVEALINDQVYAYTTSLTYEGDSAYALDVPGDDESTQVIEGGVEGDVIVFRVAGQLAGQTATWRSGTNQELDLSVTTQAVSGTPTPVVQATPTPTIKPGDQDGPAATATNQPQPTNAPGEATNTADPGAVEQAPQAEGVGSQVEGVGSQVEPTATFRPGVVEIVDESYPPTATPEPGAQGEAKAFGTANTAGEAAQEAGTIPIYWVLIPVFFLLVWLFGLWYLKHKNKGQGRS